MYWIFDTEAFYAELKKYSPVDLSQSIGVEPQTINTHIRRCKEPTGREIAGLCNAMSCDPRQFYKKIAGSGPKPARIKRPLTQRETTDETPNPVS